VRRAEVRRLMAEFRASERRACELMEIPRMSCRYQSRRDDGALRERLLELAREKPRYGYRRLHVLLRRHWIERVNHKRVWRIYRELGLSVRRTRRKRLERMMRPRPVLTAANQEWAIDFASDVLPTPGGPRKQRMGPFTSGFSLRTARYSMTRSFTFSSPE